VCVTGAVADGARGAGVGGGLSAPVGAGEGVALGACFVRTAPGFGPGWTAAGAIASAITWLRVVACGGAGRRGFVGIAGA
jgi:hypothetical protein